MYVVHPHNRLTSFYAVFIEHQWRLNRTSLIGIARICRKYVLDFQLPEQVNLAALDRSITEQLAVNPDLANLVVTELYQDFSIECNHQIWTNFLHNTSERVISNMWNRLPEYKRIEETLDLLRNAASIDRTRLFNKFNPQYNRDLLNGIEAWIYSYLRQSICSKIRKRDEFFGLSHLGVVSKESKLSIRKALSSYISNHLEGLSNYNSGDRLIIDPFLVDIYKNYLGRTRIRTNNLTANDWEEIDREIQHQWHNLKLDLPPPSIDKIQEELKIVGSYVIQAASTSISSSDAGNILLGIVEEDNVNIEEQANWGEAYTQLFVVIQKTIDTLDPIDVEILELRYREGLLQSEISPKINKDQTIVSRRLLKIEKTIVKAIRHQISHPEDLQNNKINKIAIQGMKEALRKFYSK